MKFRILTNQKPNRAAPPKRGRLLARLSGVLACLLCLSVSAADITVSGLGKVVKGTVYAEVKVDEPVKQVRMEIPGIVNRVERSAPYGLMSDKDRKLNPWDTTATADGEYVLTVVATLKDGSEVTKKFPFEIDNVAEAPAKVELSIDMSKVPATVRVGQKITVPTTGLKDGEVVWFHLFDKNWGNLIRENLKVNNNSVTFTVPDATGDRRLQLQSGRKYKKTRLIEVLSAVVVSPKPAPAPVPEPEVVVPEPKPTPEPEVISDPLPEPEPAPAPAPQAVSINLSSAPSFLKAGQKIEVAVSGIADGQTLYYHVFDKNWGNLIRSNVTVKGGKVSLVVPDVNGDRILQLQYGQKAKASKNVVVQLVEPEQAPEPEADVTPDTPSEPGTAPTLSPGNGFNGETAQPSAVGTLTTKAIARWDVVPMQEFRGIFEVGVVAHHSYGIDRVAMSFNGGPWKAINVPSLNPRTNVKEYWAKLDAKDVKDGKVEVRAIAYPKNGTPRVLDSLTLWANAGGSIDFPVYYIKPGESEVPRDLKCPTDRWLTVKYAPGASQRVSFTLRTGGNVKLEGLNMKGRVGNWNGPGVKGKVWFDEVDFLGVKSNFTAGKRLYEETTMWPVDYNWRQAYYTDFVVDHVSNPLNANHGIARNVHIKTAYEDAIRVYGLVTNVKVDRLVRGVPSGSWGYVHSDMFQLSNDLRNSIYQNIVGTDIKGQGLSGGGHYDCAFVNINVNVTTNNIGLRLFGDQHNVLYEDVNVKSPLGGQITGKPFPFSGKDIVFRDVESGNSFPFLPSGWQHPEIKVFPLLYD